MRPDPLSGQRRPSQGRTLTTSEGCAVLGRAWAEWPPVEFSHAAAISERGGTWNNRRRGDSYAPTVGPVAGPCQRSRPLRDLGSSRRTFKPSSLRRGKARRFSAVHIPMRLAGALGRGPLPLRPRGADAHHVSVLQLHAPDHRPRFEFACRPTTRRQLTYRSEADRPYPVGADTSLFTRAAKARCLRRCARGDPGRQPRGTGRKRDQVRPFDGGRGATDGGPRSTAPTRLRRTEAGRRPAEGCRLDLCTESPHRSPASGRRRVGLWR